MAKEETEGGGKGERERGETERGGKDGFRGDLEKKEEGGAGCARARPRARVCVCV